MKDEKKEIDSKLIDFMSMNFEKIEYKEWKKYAQKKRAELENSHEIMLGILENQWLEINYHELKREEYYELRESPLEILEFCINGDFITYPPPEVLWVIARQFQWYMEQEGNITLEDAFFGKPIKSKGTYAKRMADKKSKLYKAFNLKTKANPTITQSKLLEIFCNTPNINNTPSKGTCLQIYEENQRNEIDQDSFLRGFRRWKEKSDN